MTKKKQPPGLPGKDALRDFIVTSASPVNKRDIARAFGLQGQDRIALKNLLRQLMDEGSIAKDAGKSYKAPDSLPETTLIEITGIDSDGEVTAKPVHWHSNFTPPIIYLRRDSRHRQPIDTGEQMLAQLRKNPDGITYEAKPLKTVETASMPIIGVFKPGKIGGYVYPTDKKDREDYFVPPEFAEGLEEGELVSAERLLTRQYPKGKNAVRIVKQLGKKDDPRLISLIAIHAHGIPTEFSPTVLQEAEALKEADLSGGRVDIRDIPLVTIDGIDARDYDDAVFAEPDTDPQNPGGWHIIVAIADVSYYVRSGTPLDLSALERGNSTYFADRVVPMLPERLSNNLCSLMPKVNRACLACHLWIDNNGQLRGYKFFRGLMRSAARLTYEQVESAHLGHPDDDTGPLVDTVITPLYKAYSVLKRARECRGALEIDLPERKALINAEGFLTAIVPRERLQSHQLIEEFMILANVATAHALEDKNAPCVYRVHDRPSAERLLATRDFLKEMGYSLPKSDNIQPKNINHLLKLSADRPDKDLIHTLLLRTQSQAVYSPDNNGHFGLALEKYSHFTSPIRRYADLIVHRSLVRAYNLGPGGLTDHEQDALADTAQHISQTERRSMIAERDVMDRFTAQYLSQNIGAEFAGRISGVTRFGLFVSLTETGADGLVPMRSLPQDFYIHDEKRHALVGKRTGRTYSLAQSVIIRLVEADPMRGSTLFEMVDTDTKSEYRPPRTGGIGNRRDDNSRNNRNRRGKSGKPFGKNKGKRRR